MNPVLVTIGNFEIRWYSVIILVGMLIGIKLAQREAKKFNIPTDFIFNLAFWCIIIGIIGARAYYVLFRFDIYKDDLLSIFKIWEGGLAIHGGLIAGFITGIIYCKRYSASIPKMCDIAVVSIILGQAIGRWGNFFNNEAYGGEVNLATLKSIKIIPEFVIKGMHDGTVYHHPTFYYESLWCLLGFIILLIIRRFKYIKNGQVTGVYLMWYSLGRFFIEISRTDSLTFGGFQVAQVVSVILFIIGLSIVLIQSRKSHFEDLYNEADKVDVKW